MHVYTFDTPASLDLHLLRARIKQIKSTSRPQRVNIDNGPFYFKKNSRASILEVADIFRPRTSGPIEQQAEEYRYYRANVASG